MNEEVQAPQVAGRVCEICEQTLLRLEPILIRIHPRAFDVVRTALNTDMPFE